MFEDVEKDFILPNTLNAMAKTFYVKAEIGLRQDNWYRKPGSKVTGVKVIAHGEKIHDIKRLRETYLLSNGEYTEVKDRYKVRGTAEVTDGVYTYKEAEIHWYQCENIGKIEFKIKRWGDKVES